MEITYYGHSSFSVKAGDKHLLFDPFITGNELVKNINIKDIKADYILVSHGHLDHMLDVAAIAANTSAIVLCNWELYEYFTKLGVKNVKPINPGGKYNFDFGSVKCVIAQHASSLPDGSYAGTSCGFVISANEGNFYYSGDTALTLDMTLIPKWAKLDFAVFPIGDGLTMGAEDAAQAAWMVDVKKVIGVHYDTFGFIKIEKENVKKIFTDLGVQLYLPAIGEHFSI